MKGRLETDQALNTLPKEFITSEQWKKINTSKQIAREKIDHYKTNTAINIQQSREAVDALLKSTRIYRLVMIDAISNKLTNSITSSSAVSRLIAISMIRDNAGRLAAPFVNALYYQSTLSSSEFSDTIRRMEEIHVSWSLVEYLQDNLPKNKYFQQQIETTKASYYEQSEMFLRDLSEQAKVTHRLNINAYEFSMQYRKGLGAIEALQNNYINELFRLYKQEERQALTKFVIVVLILIANITLLAGIMTYIQRHILKPLSDLNKAASLLANSTENTSGKNISEIQSLFNTLNVLDQQMKLQQSIHEKLVKDSEEDPLTKLANRRRFTREALSMLAMSSENPTHLVLIDLDYFKKVNDGWGHVVGDHVLVGIADVLRKYSHPNSLSTRLGGEEFAIIFPPNIELDLDQQLEILQTKIRQLKINNEQGGTLSVTASFGVASSTSTHANALKNLLTEADEALYRAKNQGRDQICYTQSN
ncbi:GGDEF domain-containing protein [Vibrio algivorus]|uniref:diguanylate cyclase n=1 Tax=Vibrio algivorus TaxID=1667024 RepID=A0ABQ6EQ59_9VIBR|nr:GGDEF domain-containing protein [Vibrio algivorus]GLT15126.1 GGDEF domain-containing protein [Vibrio algivorus]